MLSCGAVKYTARCSFNSVYQETLKCDAVVRKWQMEILRTVPPFVTAQTFSYVGIFGFLKELAP